MPRKMVFPESICTNCGEGLKDPKADSIVWADRPDGTETATAYCPNCYFPYILVESAPRYRRPAESIPPEEPGPAEATEA